MNEEHDTGIKCVPMQAFKNVIQENERLKEGQVRAMERAEFEVSRLQSRLFATEKARDELLDERTRYVKAVERAEAVVEAAKRSNVTPELLDAIADYGEGK